MVIFVLLNLKSPNFVNNKMDVFVKKVFDFIQIIEIDELLKSPIWNSNRACCITISNFHATRTVFTYNK